MKNIKLFLFILVFILSSCNNATKHTLNCKNVKKYSINYLSKERDVRLIIFDNNDTIYLANRDMEFNEYVKTKSDEKTINKIKKTVINHLNHSSLLLDRFHGLHKGVLTLNVTSGNKKMHLELSGVSDDYLISKEFYHLMNDLKKKHKEINTVF